MNKHTTEATNDLRPISIYVSYAWDKDDSGQVKNPRSGDRWKSLRELIKSVTKEVEKRNLKKPGARVLDIRIARLRARHGMFLLQSIKERIEHSDILVMDIGDRVNSRFNENVLIELGIAIGNDKIDKRNLYILKPSKLIGPSDLQGILYSDYTSSDKAELQLADLAGFRAALRNSIEEIATERGMIGLPKDATVEVEDEKEISVN